MRVRPFLLGAATALFAAAPILAQVPAPGGRGGRGGGRGGGSGTDSGGAEGVPAVEKVSTTQHTITIDGKQIAYTAHTGTMVLRDDDGKPKATVFYIAYTQDGEDAATRPVTFFFNGGPGSASIWLDMGIMSPMHPDMGPNGAQPAPPYNLVDNPNSPLDVTDLVQVDAMMTGYSRPARASRPRDFTGDAQRHPDVRRVHPQLPRQVRPLGSRPSTSSARATARSARRGSPPSCRTSEGIELNGIMLLGTVLDFQYISPVADERHRRTRRSCPPTRPRRGTTRSSPPTCRGMTLEQVVQQSRDYAFGDYLTALAKGNTLTPAERTAAAQKLAQLTGVSQQFVLNTNLRIDAGHVPHRAAARPARDRGPLRQPHDRHQRQRREPAPGLRSIGRRAVRRVHVGVHALPAQRPQLLRPTCSTTWAGTPAAGTTPGRLRRGYPSEVEALRTGDGEGPVPARDGGRRLLRHGDAVRQRRVHVQATSASTRRTPTAWSSSTTRAATWRTSTRRRRSS